MQPLIPSFKQFQEEIKLNALKFLATAAVANVIFKVYHFKVGQAFVHTGYFAGLYISKEAIEKGAVSDNVEETRRLSMELQGNLQESSSILNSLHELVNGRKEEAIGLKGEVNSLRENVSALKNTRKALEVETQTLKRIVDHIEEAAKTLDQKIAQLTALRQEIARAKGGEFNV